MLETATPIALVAYKIENGRMYTARSKCDGQRQAFSDEAMHVNGRRWCLECVVADGKGPFTESRIAKERTDFSRKANKGTGGGGLLSCDIDAHV